MLGFLLYRMVCMGRLPAHRSGTYSTIEVIMKALKV